MARVPTYDNFQVSQQGGGKPLVQAPDMSGFLQAGRTVQEGARAAGQVLDATTDIVIDIQNRRNEAAVKEADAALADKIRDTLTNPESGFLNRKGKNAVEGFKDARTGLDEIFTESGNALTNPAQREMWADALRRRRDAALGQMTNHYARETEVYQTEASSARIRSAMLDGAAHWTDPDAQRVAKATLLAEVDSLASLKGVGDDGRKLARLDATTDYHSEVMKAMLAADQGRAALDYFTANKEEIDPTKRDDMQKGLKEFTLRGDSMALADRLTSTFAGTEGQLAEVQRLQQKGEISPELRDATEQRIWQHFQRNTTLDMFDGGKGLGEADPAAIAPSIGGVSELVGRLFPGATITSGLRSANDPLSKANPDSYHPKGQALDIRPIPGTTFNEFVGKLKGAGLQIIEAKNEVGAGRSKHATGDHWHIAWRGAAPNSQIKTDPTAFAVLTDRMHADPVSFAAQFDPAQWADKISAADLRGFVTKAADLKTKGQKAADSFKTRGQALTSLGAELAAIGIDTSPKVDSEEARVFARYKRSFTDAVDAEEGKQKRQLTRGEMVAIGRGLMTEGAIEDGGWFGTDKKARFFELSSAQRLAFKSGNSPSVNSLAVSINKIPAPSRAWIERYFKQSYGRQPSANEIVALYPMLKARGRIE